MIPIRSTMLQMICRTTLGLAALALAPMFVAPSAEAGSITYTLGTVFNGGTPTSTPPWLTATFADNGADTVRLTLTADLNVNDEFISDVAFNVLSTIVPSSLSIDHVSGKTATVQATTQGAQGLTGGGSAGSGFDINLAFSTAGNNGGANRFKGTDVVVYDISRTGLTFADFEFTNTGSANAHVGAHIQGIPGVTGPSGAVKDGGVAVPEPSSIVLSGLGLGAVGLLTMRRRAQVAS
ncbi:PEP-CTERM sorting domain-containing protein [Paludisphaera mucosa]|uniref:PEP-CTERM sorting domain-containing protein n=1 Tax=Paludisphaera mucosa TaxID=3030827 RepID=A0ABT6FAL0_9BACT|nr:PEP-CTERM sorting domain-containing protein [Paludisphaera mucosa]MDG3004562.1 PEP-CTERM sorting domain-containing protein [Paludisphaera mucosa]